MEAEKTSAGQEESGRGGDSGCPGGSHPDRSSLIQGDVVLCGRASEEAAG